MLDFINEIEKFVPQDDSAELEEKLFLYGLIRSIKPKIVVETGTHRGKTSLYMVQGLYDNGEGHLHTADPIEWGQHENFKHIPELESFITFYQKPGKDLIVENIDLLFIDGFHEKLEVLAEIKALFPYLSPQAIVVFHDCDTATNILADVNGAIEEAKLNTVWIPTQNRMRIYQHSNI